MTDNEKRLTQEKHRVEEAIARDRVKEQAQQFDEDELYSERYKIRPQIEQETISDLHQIYGNSFSTDMFDNVKSETDKSIGETEKHSIIKRLENAKSKAKTKQTKPHNQDVENER